MAGSISSDRAVRGWPADTAWALSCLACRIAHIGHCVRAVREQRIQDAACSAGFSSYVHFREHHLHSPDRVWIDVVCYTVPGRSAELGNVPRSVNQIFAFRNGRYFVYFHQCARFAMEKATTVGARPVAIGRDVGIAIGFNHVDRYRRTLRSRLVRCARLLSCVCNPGQAETKPVRRDVETRLGHWQARQSRSRGGFAEPPISQPPPAAT